MITNYPGKPWDQCKSCGSWFPELELTLRADLTLICRDGERCARYKRIREDTEDEFFAFGPPTTWMLYEDWVGRVQTASAKERDRQTRNLKRRKPKTQRMCEICFTDISTKQGNAKYCSKKCGWAACSKRNYAKRKLQKKDAK